MLGSNAKTDESGLKGAEARVWLYVGRTQPNTTDDQVVKYLKDNLKATDVGCERLNGKSQYPSFKISAPARFKDTLNEPAFWPVGVTVRRFRFRNFQSLRPTQEAT